MAKMYITEYEGIPLGAESAGIQIPIEPPLAFQEVDFTVSAPSVNFNEDTKLISIQLDSDGYIQFGKTPVAVNTAGSRTSHLYQANSVSFHGVNSSLKVAAVTSV